MPRTTRRPIAAALGLAVAAVVTLVTAAPAFALSADAQTIVDAAKAEYADMKPVCSSPANLKQALTPIVIALATANKINPDKTVARAAGQEAGRYLYFHCPPP